MNTNIMRTIRHLFLAIAALAAISSASFAQTYNLSPAAKLQFFDAAGTTTQQATYSDRSGTSNAVLRNLALAGNSSEQR